MSETRMEEKKKKLLECLDKGLSQVHLDPRRPGVIAPEHLKNTHILVLNLSYSYDPPDLTVSSWGVRETLTFGPSRFTVGLPWSAIFAIGSLKNNEMFMYPDDMPAELAVKATERVKTEKLKGAKAAPPTAQSVLRDVVEVIETPKEKVEPSPPKRGHLRLVK
jgi:stringent starvation protein B